MRKNILATAVALALMQPGLASAADEHHKATEAATAATSLSLNHGQKWNADKHTVDSVASMRTSIGKIPGKPSQASIEEFHATGKQLQEGLQTLIRGCTMTGPAHDQLHAWISGLAPEIQELSQTETLETGRASRDKIVELLDSFDAHFEVQP